MKVLLLGKYGMLGNAVYKSVSSLQGVELLCTTRLGDKEAIKFDAAKDSISRLIEFLRPDYVVNCIGINWNHEEKSIGNLYKTFKINSFFSRNLISVAERLNTHAIQILTDGVFSGKKGQYHEKSIRSDMTIYGQSKKLGETRSNNVLGLRCSIIGPQTNLNQYYLLEWLKSQPQYSSIQGYENHLWNGITTQAFARIISGIIRNKSKIFGKYHLMSAGYVTKYELLTLLAKKFGRDDITINKSKFPRSIDRTLSTNYLEQHKWFWKIGGYVNIPSVGELVNEL